MHRLLLFSATCSQPLTVAANASEVDRPAQRAARDAQSCRPDERCKSAMGSDTHPDGGCVLKFGQIKCTNAIDLTSAPLAAVAATHAPTGIDAIGAKKKSGPLRDDPDRVGPDKKSSPIKSRQRALSNQQEPSAQKHTPADWDSRTEPKFSTAARRQLLSHTWLWNIYRYCWNAPQLMHSAEVVHRAGRHFRCHGACLWIIHETQPMEAAPRAPKIVEGAFGLPSKNPSERKRNQSNLRGRRIFPRNMQIGRPQIDVRPPKKGKHQRTFSLIVTYAASDQLRATNKSCQPSALQHPGRSFNWIWRAPPGGVLIDGGWTNSVKAWT